MTDSSSVSHDADHVPRQGGRQDGGASPAQGAAATWRANARRGGVRSLLAKAIVTIIALPVALAGCADYLPEKDETQSYTLIKMSRFDETRHLFVYTPKQTGAPTFGGGPYGPNDGLAGHMTWPTSNYCKEDDEAVASFYFRAKLYESMGAEPDQTKEWYNVGRCGETYALLIDEVGDLRLYHCEPRDEGEPVTVAYADACVDSSEELEPTS